MGTRDKGCKPRSHRNKKRPDCKSSVIGTRNKGRLNLNQGVMDTREKVRLNCKRGLRKAYFDGHQGKGCSIVKPRVMGNQKD